MAKVRVYELAKEFGVESKAVMAKLQEMGEFVRSASSTIEAPVVQAQRSVRNTGSEAGPRAQARWAGRGGPGSGRAGRASRGQAGRQRPGPVGAPRCGPAGRVSPGGRQWRCRAGGIGPVGAYGAEPTEHRAW